MRHFHSWLLAIVCLCAFACNDTTPDTPKIDPGSIANPYERWKAHNITNYSMVEEVFCFCGTPPGAYKVIVRGSNIVDAIRLEDNQHLPDHELKHFATIDELFAILHKAQSDEPADSLSVEFDGRFGYPVDISIDYRLYTVDDEIYYRISSFEELHPPYMQKEE